MSSPVLHYIYDPMCGWCYGAAPLVASARNVIEVVGHAGGMMTGNNRQQVSPALRNYVMPHDQRIAELTGQTFSEAYFDGLLLDPKAVFDSAPPITAILAVQTLTGRGLDLLERIQIAHYVEGRRIADRDVLTALAVELGVDWEAFATEYKRVEQDELQPHIDASRQLLARVGGHGFPTFVLEQDGRMHAFDTGHWLGRPEEWRDHLRQYTPAATTPTASSSS